MVLPNAVAVRKGLSSEMTIQLGEFFTVHDDDDDDDDNDDVDDDDDDDDYDDDGHRHRHRHRHHHHHHHHHHHCYGFPTRLLKLLCTIGYGCH